MRAAVLVLGVTASCRLVSTSGGSSKSLPTPEPEATDRDVAGRPAPSDGLVPEPEPPAHLTAGGVVEGPGGPISDAPADCGPEHNHCLRGNAYFMYGSSLALSPVFEFQGKWYTWEGRQVDVGHVYRTRPVRADTVRAARFLFVYAEPIDGRNLRDTNVYGILPTSERDALTSGRWTGVRGIKEVDAAHGTLLDDANMRFRLSSVREAIWVEDVEPPVTE